VEEARTNLVLRSQEFDNASWTAFGITVSSDATVAPNGTTTADLITTTLTAGVNVYQAVTISTAAWTWSVYAKAGTASWLYIDAYDGANNFSWFNISSGTTGTNAAGNTSRITSLGNGWYRCSVTRTAASAAGFFPIGLSDADNSSAVTSGVNASIWGAQLEAGAFATSYIHVPAASTVTRAADNLSLSTGAFPLSATVGTLFGEVVGRAATGSGKTFNIVSLTNGTINEWVNLRGFNSNPEALVFDSGNYQTIDAGTWVSTGTNRLGVVWAASDAAASYNGASAVTNASVGTPSPTSLSIGTEQVASSQYNGIIRKILYLPRRMSNAELQTITT
jgi:hypothetical protein